MKTKRRTATTITKKSKKKKRPIFYLFIIILAIALVVLWFLFTFFKVRSIEVIGDSVYSKNQIIDLCGVSMGENIFEIDKEEVGRNIESNFTMVESVKVSHKFFGTIVIDVEKAKPMVVSQRSDKTYILLSDKLKILKMGLLIQPPSVAVLEGTTLIDPEEGSYAQFSEEDKIKEEALKEILIYIDKHQLSDVNKIDISNYLDIIMEYDSKIGIKLGTRSRMDMKIKDIKYLIDEKIPTGTNASIDATLLESQTKANIRYQVIGSLDEFYKKTQENFFTQEAEADVSEEETNESESSKDDNG